MKTMQKTLKLIDGDKWLEPFAPAIVGRHRHAVDKIEELTGGNRSLHDFASGHLYFGLHRNARGWTFREWAPNATKIFLTGDFNKWKESPLYELKPVDENGVWEVNLPENALHHGDLYKMRVYWQGGCGERMPAWCRRAVQDEHTKVFCAQVWEPEEPYVFKTKNFRPSTDPLLIYECHIGMAQDAQGVGTYEEFRKNILPRVVSDGYNCLQIMAVQEHPYYGSFGYHVSNFFAPSSRFGTPEELKRLIDEAHSKGIAVIMDLVHSHAAKNENEGLGNLAGDPNQYFYPGDRHTHPAWDSLCFDYGKNEVLHFLLSNCRYWLEEFRFDGFRFDGVTSMLYYDHGLGKAFGGYGDYFDGSEDDNAICYLTLANKVIHDTNPHAITIAEDVSGMPGLAAPFSDGGYGFDYRLAMNIPDFWIKTIKEKRDEDWKPSAILWELTNRRSDERNISYCESHDQALVGDKTIIFRLVDADMYWHFSIADRNGTVDRGMALHKMIRLVTLATLNGGYLNFMGNEFGHPEWIDFPREGNGWSYKYARRQWNLVDNKELCFGFLGKFDKAMLALIKNERHFCDTDVVEIWHDDGDQVMAFMRGSLLFVFNFNPVKSFNGYGFRVPEGKYTVELNTDAEEFGGYAIADDSVVHSTEFDKDLHADGKGWMKTYIPARSAVVMRYCKSKG
jgi:1,4-alpha-glucan branching enzyme